MEQAKFLETEQKFLRKTRKEGAIEVGVTDREVELTREYFLKRGYSKEESEKKVRGVAIHL